MSYSWFIEYSIHGAVLDGSMLINNLPSKLSLEDIEGIFYTIEEFHSDESFLAEDILITGLTRLVGNF